MTRWTIQIMTIIKDLDIITSTMMKNERFKKLLYYTTPDALERSNLSNKETAELFSKNIKINKLALDRSVIFCYHKERGESSPYLHCFFTNPTIERTLYNYVKKAFNLSASGARLSDAFFSLLG